MKLGATVRRKSCNLATPNKKAIEVEKKYDLSLITLIGIYEMWIDSECETSYKVFVTGNVKPESERLNQEYYDVCLSIHYKKEESCPAFQLIA